MVLLRNGKATPTPMPGLGMGEEEEMVSIPGHHSLLEINQKHGMGRELKALGLLQDGQLTREAMELATPALPERNPFNYWDIPLIPERCQEVLWTKGAPRQCGSRPSRGGDRCWRHNAATRTGRTAARQNIVRQSLERRRDEQQQRRENERHKMLENKRLQPPIELGDEPPILDIVDNVHVTLDTDWDADRRADQMQTLLDQTEQTDINLRRPFHHRGIPLKIDDEEQIYHGIVGPRHDNDRLFELATMTVRGEPRVVFAKCMLCRVYHYPVETSLVPERWSIKCCTCEARVHRHCQETVPLFYFDHLYQCPACLAEN